MAHLTLNGVTFPVGVRSGATEHEELGDEVRALDGTLITHTVTQKRRWPCETVTLEPDTAKAWVALVQGRGHKWDFTTLYSSKFLGTSATSGTVTANVASGKFNKKLQVGATSYARWTPTGRDSLIAGALNPVGDYTLTVWRLESGTWYHYIIRNRSGSVTRYKDGASHGAATAWISVHASGYLQLGDGTNADDFSDLVAVPFAIPTDWVSSWYGYGRAFPALPRLEANGDVIFNPTTPLSVRGRRAREIPEPTAADPDATRVECELLEV